MVSLWSLSFGRAPRLIWAKVVSSIEHTSAHKVLRSKAQCSTRLKPYIHGTNILDLTNTGALGGVVPRTSDIKIDSSGEDKKIKRRGKVGESVTLSWEINDKKRKEKKKEL